ncbi:MAG: ATP-dependent DNA ligase [Acidimicrobiia bacterium]|nr:ATP-dependent DNA ligase [Acidimicrobiia bacterium]
MLFADLVATSDRVTATSARNDKIGLLAEAVARLGDADLAAGVAYLAGIIPQGAIGVGYASLGDVPEPAQEPALRITDVDAALSDIAAIGGAGSMGRRREVLDGLFARATAEEQSFLSALLVGGLRQGAGERVMMDAIAKASRVPATPVRRAAMFTGDIGEVAVAARRDGRSGVAAFGLRLFRPVLPMLAKTAAGVAEAMEKQGTAIVERKLDGARIQVHLHEGEVRVYTRNLNNVTDRLPEVVAVVSGFDATAAVLDGEAMAIRGDGRPYPFQVTMARFGTEGESNPIELRPFFFDILHLDGDDVLDSPAVERLELLDRVVPADLRIPRIVTDDPADAERFFADTIAGGHEGVMIKSLDSVYAAGRRGAGWLKVKPVHTLDLVVLAVEWGSGRRHGWLSNIHLGARAPDGGYVMLGKTFKGMTDAILEWQTKRFLELETHRKGHVVYVRPEQVVEIAFDGIQASSRYPGGMALRFARVKGYREDKSAAEADTIETVRRLFEGARS